MTERKFYIDAYCDEVVPCDCTLATWADWLSKPAPEWNRDAAAKPGDRFPASVMRLDADITATLTTDGWSFDRDPKGADFLAVRYAPRLGWSPEDIICGTDMRQALVDHLSSDDLPADIGDTLAIAVGFDEPNVVLVYVSPTEMRVETVQ